MGYIRYQTNDGKIHENKYDGRIEEINLSNNAICKIMEINGLISLRKLCLGNNHITKMGGLDTLTSLRKLYLDNNQITKIEGLSSLTSLRILYLHNNQITKIEGLGSLVSLRELYLTGNQITKIRGLGSLTSLEQLYLSDNQIMKIEGLDNLRSLRKLFLVDNLIRNVPISIINLPSLYRLCCNVPLSPTIHWFLNRNKTKSSRTIYDSKQNIHDNQINRSITESVCRLLDKKVTCTDSEVLSEITSDRVLSTESKAALIQYSKITDMHSQLNVTFMEALKSVWHIIRKHKKSAEIKRILDQEIQDSIGNMSQYKGAYSMQAINEWLVYSE
jgi:Leucine-rich repeat (LRR) protein